MRQKIFFGILFSVLLLIGTIPAFAISNSVTSSSSSLIANNASTSSITILVPKTTYYPGDALSISGTVTPFDSNQAVTIQVSGPPGFPGAFSVVSPDDDGNWTANNIMTFIAAYDTGTYTVTAKYQGSSSSKNVLFSFPEITLNLVSNISLFESLFTDIILVSDLILIDSINILSEINTFFTPLTNTFIRILTEKLDLETDYTSQLECCAPDDSDESIQISSSIQTFIYQSSYNFVLKDDADESINSEIKTTSNLISMDANSENDLIVFNLLLEGESGTKGSTLITLPIEYVSEDIILLIKGKSAPYDISIDNTGFHISFEYVHSEVPVNLIIGDVSDEDLRQYSIPLIILLMIILLIVLIIVVYVRKRNNYAENPIDSSEIL